MKLLYPAFFHKEEDGYWVEFPDIDGCFSQGDTLDEVFFNATEALSVHCLSLLESKEKLPVASDISNLTAPSDGFISLVNSNVGRKDISIKKTLTIPSWLNDLAIENQVNFSKTLQNALIKELNIQEN